VLCESLEIHDQLTGDPRILFCNGYFDVRYFVENNSGTPLIGDVYFV